MQPFKIWCETEKEKRAVLRKMEREGIRWADGSKPTALCCDYQPPIALFVEMTQILWKRHSKSDYETFNEYQPISVREYLGNQEKIIIYRDGQRVVALNKFTGERSEARCNPSDTFDFGIGARLAFDRLIPNKAPAASEPKGFTGEAVYIGGNEINDCFFTTGKIYEFHDGKVRDDDGDLRPNGDNKTYKFGVTHEIAKWHFLPIVK